MRHPSTPSGNNGNTARTRTRGAIRTHLGRKRAGPRNRAVRSAAFDGIAPMAGMDRQQQEDLFDRLLDRFQQFFTGAGETTAAAFDSALDAACNALVSAGEFTAENAERLRHYVRRDLLQRDHPGMTFRTGEITRAGTLTCSGCGWTVHSARSSMLPPCPQCGDSVYRRTA